MRRGGTKPRVVSHGKKPPANGITPGKNPKPTKFQQELKKWPPKIK